ncbi:MAG: STAS domain-containing protein [SAR324 cluster bacterium]|nr:STAS domain-containing protein [SAR324 cluster bacterium]
MITHRTKNKICLVTMEGEVTQNTVRELSPYITALLASEKPESLVLNLQKIYYHDPLGVREILLLSKAVQKKAVRFSLCELSEKLENKFKNNVLGINISIYATEKQAMVSNTGNQSNPEPSLPKPVKKAAVPDAWVNIRIPGDLLARLDSLADQQNQKRSETIVEALREYTVRRN